MNEQIKTIRQVRDELRESALELKSIFSEFKVAPLQENEDLEKTKVTLENVLAKIPQEEQLANIIKKTPSVRKDDLISNYNGNCDLLQKAKKNLSSLKIQQRNIYYLATKLNLPEVSEQFKQPIPENVMGLQSYRITEDKKSRIKFIEKNVISEKYFEQIAQENLHIPRYGNRDQLQSNDLLINICYYDSHNGKKQNQFLCLDHQKLADLSAVLYCMIEEQERSNLPKMTPSFFVIENNVYYDGNKSEVDAMLNRGVFLDKTKYYTYEMKKAKFEELRVVFGRPYLFRHLGGCDHFIVFKQARLYQEDNPLHDIIDKRKYPVMIYQSKMKKKKCEGCTENFSEFISLSDPLKKGDNLYLCHLCLKNLSRPESKVIPYTHE